MSEYVQPLLIALVVLLVPACTRLAVTAMTHRLNEGRIVANSTAKELRAVTEKEAQRVNELLEEHRFELMSHLDRIESQTIATNARVADHALLLTKHSAEIDILLGLMAVARTSAATSGKE